MACMDFMYVRVGTFEFTLIFTLRTYMEFSVKGNNCTGLMCSMHILSGHLIVHILIFKGDCDYSMIIMQ